MDGSWNILTVVRGAFLLMLAWGAAAGSPARGQDPVGAASSWTVYPPEVIAARLRDGGRQLVVVDVRGREDYQSATVPGAVASGADPESFVPAAGVTEVVLIAPQPLDNELLERWAHHASAAGLRLGILSGGFPGWRAAGGSVEAAEPEYAVPGEVSFTVPKGLCESGPAVLTYPGSD